jgi:hypothetical protein
MVGWQDLYVWLRSQGSIYFWFRDQGAIVAGALALVAGLLAYRGGVRQARAILEASDDQRREFDAHTRAIAREADETDRRERRSLAYLLEGETWRIKTEAEFRHRLVQKQHPDQPRALIESEMRGAFKIVPRAVVEASPNMPNLFRSETCDAIVALLACVDQLNSQLEILTQLGELHADELLGSLVNVGERADAAMAQLNREYTPPNSA